MMTLTRLQQVDERRLYAVWHEEADGLGYDFGALHDADGRLLAANMNEHPPRLTSEQIASAVPYAPAVHPADELFGKLVAHRPELAARGEKAARLVKEGAVRLTGAETAVVVGDSDTYDVTGYADRCGCVYGRLRDGWCSHRLAVRMARALGQAVQPLTEAEKEARSEARARANRAAQIGRNAQAHQCVLQAEAKDRRKYRDGDGARQWIRVAQANGAATVPAAIYERAIGGK